MKRRRMIQSVLGVSAASALPRPLFSQQSNPPPALDETPKLAANAPDSVANGVLRFFDPAGFSALRRLGEILVPARQNAPGALEAEAAELPAADANSILAPLREAWTYQEPADLFARFLRAAKADFIEATVNSRQWAAASSGRRGASGLNTYWFPIE